MNNLNFNLDKSKIIKFFNEKKFQKISKLSKLILSKFKNDYDFFLFNYSLFNKVLYICK